MPFPVHKCRITVLKRTLHRDLIEEYLDDEYKDIGRCEAFAEGQVFEIDPANVPQDFCARCAWAWADIRDDMMKVAVGGDIPGMRHAGTIITGCRDWLRPVLFKVERMEDTMEGPA